MAALRLAGGGPKALPMGPVGYPGARTAAQVIGRLRAAIVHSSHEFWPGEVAITDPDVVDASRVHGARQVTDTCLLALAVKRSGRLVNFDSGIALSAVNGARARHLVTLA